MIATVRAKAAAEHDGEDAVHGLGRPAVERVERDAAARRRPVRPRLPLDVVEGPGGGGRPGVAQGAEHGVHLGRQPVGQRSGPVVRGRSPSHEGDGALGDELLVVVERGDVVAPLERHPLDGPAHRRRQVVAAGRLDDVVLRARQQQERARDGAERWLELVEASNSDSAQARGVPS
jgi:hypothetical protein